MIISNNKIIMVYLFKNKIPVVNDIVLVNITDINNLNIVGELIDYNNLTGYISYSELAKKKRYKLHKIVNIGKEVITQVTGFNKEKNYVELSIRAVINTDIENFTNYRKKYIGLYNLWRYIYMKINTDLEMNINIIDNQSLNNFMEKTLWKIETVYELNDNEEVFNPELIYKKLINKTDNQEIINLITDYDKKLIKNILDEYSNIKIKPEKQSKYQEFALYSYNINGLTNIKNVLDYKTYEIYDQIIKNYDISILYLTNSKYSLNIKEKKQSKEDINEIYNSIIKEITLRCEQYGVVITI
jgi:translation initiation factor 2 alpha subunit (eIF-2alpha)